jgi:hypothetical protein
MATKRFIDFATHLLFAFLILERRKPRLKL